MSRPRNLLLLGATQIDQFGVAGCCLGRFPVSVPQETVRQTVHQDLAQTSMLLFTTTTPTLPPHTQEHNKLTLHNTTKQKNVGPPAAYHAQLLPLLIQVLARKGRQARGA